MSGVYRVEIDGAQYDLEGDHPPSEAEARATVAAHHAAPPTPAGPVSRFMAPVGENISGLAQLPGAIAHIGSEALQGHAQTAAAPFMDMAKRQVIDPMVEHGAQAGTEFGQGNYGEGARQLLEAVPVAGPVISDVRASADSGDIAGALGKTAMAALPFARAPKFAEGLASLLKSRSAARMLGVMRPTAARMATAESIAPEVAAGVDGREAMGGLGVGTRKTLADRARSRAKGAGADIEALQSLTQRVDPSPIAAKLRTAAAAKETLAPSGQVFTQDPALVDALRKRAAGVDEMASAFGSDVPSGELFKQRAVLGKKLGSKAYEKMPGSMTPADLEAGTMEKSATSDLLHSEVPGSVVPDHEYHVMRNAYVNIENSRLRDMMGRGGKQVMNLLAGRLAGAVAGGAAGYAAGGHMTGLAGAALGVALGESAYWGSLRATTYADIARLLKAGDVDGAATIIQRSASAYSVDKAIKDRERNRKAHLALQSQALGSPAP